MQLVERALHNADAEQRAEDAAVLLLVSLWGSTCRSVFQPDLQSPAGIADVALDLCWLLLEALELRI